MTLVEEVKVIKTYESFILGVCKCGCGGRVNFRGKTNPYLIKFLVNHHWKLDKYKRDQKGEKGSGWKRGSWIHKGYRMLSNKWDHPNADSRGVIPEHVYNFTVRNGVLFCCMLRNGIVHHEDENKLNNEISNLRGMLRKKHGYLHNKGIKREKRTGNRICLNCESNSTYVNKKTGYEMWYKKEDGFVCMVCYNK